MDLLTELTILVLAAFVGFEVISKVPNMLHTPLMSATNAIHGIVLLGGILLIGEADGSLNKLLLVIAIAFGTINVVGGFLVTDRMLEMFKSAAGAEPPKDDGGVTMSSPPSCRTPTSSDVLLPRRVRAVHPRPARAEPPAHRAAGQPHRGGRHGDRGRRDAARSRRSTTTA